MAFVDTAESAVADNVSISRLSEFERVLALAGVGASALSLVTSRSTCSQHPRQGCKIPRSSSGISENTY